MSVFHLYVAFFGAPDAYVMRGMHPLAFAPGTGLPDPAPGRDGKAKSPNLFDLALLVRCGSRVALSDVQPRIHPHADVLRR